MDKRTVKTGEKMKKWKALFISEQLLDNINTDFFSCLLRMIHVFLSTDQDMNIK